MLMGFLAVESLSALILLYEMMFLPVESTR
jgi:hypothetical protein